MELMQKCFPFKWMKYWNCGTKEFDFLLILQDIDNVKLSVQDRLLLTLLARIWADKKDALTEVNEAALSLNDEHRQILADWIEDQRLGRSCPAHVAACPCSASKQFDSSPVTAHKAK
jgi:hypothetical protein